MNGWLDSVEGTARRLRRAALRSAHSTTLRQSPVLASLRYSQSLHYATVAHSSLRRNAGVVRRAFGTEGVMKVRYALRAKGVRQGWPSPPLPTSPSVRQVEVSDRALPPLGTRLTLRSASPAPCRTLPGARRARTGARPPASSSHSCTTARSPSPSASTTLPARHRTPTRRRASSP